MAGDVRETLPASAPSQLALLRLNTHFYDSTHHGSRTPIHACLRGCSLIDDYGHWKGSRQAVDEYFEHRPIFLSRVDYSGRLGIEAAAIARRARADLTQPGPQPPGAADELRAAWPSGETSRPSRRRT